MHTGTPATATYRGGDPSWVAAGGTGGWLLADLDPTDGTVLQCWGLLRSGAAADEVLDAILQRGLRTVSGFALLSTSGAGSLVVRGGARAVVTTADGSTQEIAGAGVTTWREVPLPDDVRSVHLLGAAGDGDGPSAPLAGGVTLARELTVEFAAPDVPAPAASSEPPAADPAVADPAVADPTAEPVLHAAFPQPTPEPAPPPLPEFPLPEFPLPDAALPDAALPDAAPPEPAWAAPQPAETAAEPVAEVPVAEVSEPVAEVPVADVSEPVTAEPVAEVPEPVMPLYVAPDNAAPDYVAPEIPAPEYDAPRYVAPDLAEIASGTAAGEPEPGAPVDQPSPDQPTHDQTYDQTYDQPPAVEPAAEQSADLTPEPDVLPWTEAPDGGSPYGAAPFAAGAATLPPDTPPSDQPADQPADQPVAGEAAEPIDQAPAWSTYPVPAQSAAQQQPAWADPAGQPATQAYDPFATGDQPAAAAATIEALRCEHGHFSPPGSATCRVCAFPLDGVAPQQVTPPTLGVLSLSTGDIVALDRTIIMGRNPKSEDTGARAPHLVRLPSPGHDISRTHIEIRVDGWQVLVTDLNSMNGTVVAAPWQEPQQIRGGEAVVIEPGTLVTVAGEVTFRYDVTG